MEQPITSTNKAGDRIKDEFTGFYRGRVIISEDFKDEVAL
ncbi:hypothetical protein MPCS_01337 [Candidatus Megaera polyxenophila]|jgi:hypothetical protein|nr:hypothetical protein MPCS_00281 [Candidatus Megaera polyxenophila]BBB57327.1 hypothetical protein MPCS_01337 [Candidatus Megaera polyxenophila]